MSRLWAWLRQQLTVFYVLGLMLSFAAFVQRLEMGRDAAEFLLHALTRLTGWEDIVAAMGWGCHTFLNWWREVVQSFWTITGALSGLQVPDFVQQPIAVAAFAFLRGRSVGRRVYTARLSDSEVQDPLVQHARSRGSYAYQVRVARLRNELTYLDERLRDVDEEASGSLEYLHEQVEGIAAGAPTSEVTKATVETLQTEASRLEQRTEARRHDYNDRKAIIQSELDKISAGELRLERRERIHFERWHRYLPFWAGFVTGAWVAMLVAAGSSALFLVDLVIYRPLSEPQSISEFALHVVVLAIAILSCLLIPLSKPSARRHERMRHTIERWFSEDYFEDAGRVENISDYRRAPTA